MFCSRQTNNMINKIHERALRIVLNDHISDFETMLRNINGVTIHHRNIQILMIELFKIKHDLASPIMDSMLHRRTICYNIRNLQEFHSEKKRIVFYGLETISYLAPQLWKILPEEFKQRNIKSLFKSALRHWICNKCPCRLCKVFVPNLGFIWIILMHVHIMYLALQGDTCPIGNIIVLVCYLTCISLHLPNLSI